MKGSPRPPCPGGLHGPRRLRLIRHVGAAKARAGVRRVDLAQFLRRRQAKPRPLGAVRPAPDRSRHAGTAAPPARTEACRSRQTARHPGRTPSARMKAGCPGQPTPSAYPVAPVLATPSGVGVGSLAERGRYQFPSNPSLSTSPCRATARPSTRLRISIAKNLV